MLARIIFLASSSLTLVLLAACGGEVSSSGPSGSGGVNQGGGGTNQGGGGANQGGGGTNQGGGGTNQGGGGTNQGGGGVGGAGGCPASPPVHGDACGSDLTCDYVTTVFDCGNAALPLQASCKEGTWRVLYPASCTAYDPAAACPPLGHYTVTETGPYDDPSAPVEGYNGPFELFITTGKGGILQVEGYHSHLSPATCVLKGGATIDEDCFAVEGQMFCTYIDRKFNIGFTAVPATGTVTLSCWGECGFEATAPVEAIKDP